jgi:hypothetical protein
MSGAPSNEKSGLSSVLVTWTASVQFSKFAAGPRQHRIYISVFITPGERVAQLHPQALVSSGTSGVPFPVATIVGPWGVQMQQFSPKLLYPYGQCLFIYLFIFLCFILRRCRKLKMYSAE